MSEIGRPLQGDVNDPIQWRRLPFYACWRDPKEELPEEGCVVAVIYSHGKKHKPMSYQVMFGEVEWENSLISCRVNSSDFTGSGNWAVYLKKDPAFEYLHDDIGFAWCYWDEFPLPEWSPIDPHWEKSGWINKPAPQTKEGDE